MPEDIFGDPLPAEQRTSRKRQLTDKEQRTELQRVEDCLRFPLLYEMAEHLPVPQAVGCPPEYPAVVYLMMAAIMPITGSKRSAAGILQSDTLWRTVRKQIRANLSRRQAARLPARAPSRSQYHYAEATLLAPSFDRLEEEFRRYSLRQALEQGLFPIGDPRNWALPERRQLLVGDATVPKAPSKAEQSITVDPETGEYRLRRVDPAARVYYENGEEEKRLVRGTKWFFGSARDHGYWRRVERDG